MPGNGWAVSESEDYERGVLQCGGALAVDEAVAPVIYALHRNPLGFPETPITGVRLARTKVRINGPDITLSHTVWFCADEFSQSVTLLWVEVTKPADIGWDDDDVPF